MEISKDKIGVLLLGVIAGAIILALSIIPIPSAFRFGTVAIVVGVFVTWGLIRPAAETKRNKIIAYIVLWAAITASVAISLNLKFILKIIRP